LPVAHDGDFIDVPATACRGPYAARVLADPTGSAYTLAWPREALQVELEWLLRQPDSANLDGAELLLEEAFTSDELAQDFKATANSRDPWERSGSSTESRNGRRGLLADLLQEIDRLPERRAPRPYWHQRQGRQLDDPAGALSDTRGPANLRSAWSATVRRLFATGYMAKAAPAPCVDDESPPPPADESMELALARLLGQAGLWPLDVSDRDEDIFYSLVEAVGDLVARPRNKFWHRWNECGWHYSQFAATAGQLVYRAEVNELFAQAGVGLRLASEGEDAGRLVRVVDDQRDDLVHRVLATPDNHDRAATQHAIALFRGRAANREERRSAVLALARVLEDRRELIESQLGKKDEGALFRIANEFDLRHRGVSGRGREQYADYDDAFLDWIFWWYLATVDLTDKLLARPSSTL